MGRYVLGSGSLLRCFFVTVFCCDSCDETSSTLNLLNGAQSPHWLTRDERTSAGAGMGCASRDAQMMESQPRNSAGRRDDARRKHFTR